MRYELDSDDFMRKLKMCSDKIRSASIPALTVLECDEELTDAELDALEQALGYRLRKVEE